MDCSICQSTNLVKVSLAYEQGLSEYKGRSRSSGLSLGTGGLGLWGGRAKTKGTFQTRLSERLPSCQAIVLEDLQEVVGGANHSVVRGNCSVRKCSECQGIEPDARLGHRCLCCRFGLFMVAYLAIQPPRVSGSA